MKIWLERDGQVDIIVYGCSKLDILFVVAAEVLVLLGCVASLAVIA